ncbi:anion permease, partial [Thermodesulfobacteriota bacterium]
MNTKIKLLISAIVPLLILLLPGSFFRIPGLTTIEHRFIALFFMAALFWVLEPIPVFSTSLLIIFLELIMVSDKGIIFFRTGSGESGFGTLLSYREILASFASPIIILFLGGFFLAKV